MSEHTAEKDAPETRTRRRIRKAVESRGFHVLSMEWEPWYDGGEMSGICGGWTVLTDRPWEPNTNYGDEAMGLSVEDVLAWIDYFFKPAEPCDCYPDDRKGRMPMTPLKGDPARPLHEPACRWFIRYELPWWTRVTSPAKSLRQVASEHGITPVGTDIDIATGKRILPPAEGGS